MTNYHLATLRQLAEAPVYVTALAALVEAGYGQWRRGLRDTPEYDPLGPIVTFIDCRPAREVVAEVERRARLEAPHAA